MGHFKLCILTLAASIVLTACGGGGSKSESRQITNNNSQFTYEPATTPVPGLLRETDANGNGINTRKMNINDTSSAIPLEIDRDALPQGSITDHSIKYGGREYAKLAGYNRQYSMTGVVAIVDDKNIIQQLLDLGGNFSLGSNLSSKGMKEALNSTWRVIPDRLATNTFTFGDVTRYYDNIGLMKGSATYKGNATRYDSVSARVRHIGETTLNVNFDEKTIEGEIKTDDFRRNIVLNKTNILGLKTDGSTATQDSITKEISDIAKQINDINSEINKITQPGSSNGGVGNAIGESAERSGIQNLTKEQIEQIKPLQEQIATLKNNIEGMKNTGNSFNGTAVAVGNNLYNTVTGTYQGRFFGPNAEEAGGIVTFDTTEDPTSFSTVRQ